MEKKTFEPIYDRDALAPLIAVCGGSLEDDACGPQWWASSRDQAPIQAWQHGVVCPLPDLGLVQAEGTEASRFLQSQFTNEVEKQSPGQLALNGYCTAKGRLLLTAHQWVEAERVSLLVSRPLASALAKRLSMFVLRAKARIHDRSAGHLCIGLAGQAIGQALAEFGIDAPATGAVVHGPEGLVALGIEPVPAEAQPIARVLLVIPIAQLPECWPRLTRHLQAVSSPQWRWGEILTGTPWITARTSEQFVPQMVNLDLAGGVSFKKGCYPGQEVVARSHYLGKLKRRMFAGAIAASPSAPLHPAALPEPGDDILPASGGEPCGEVVLSGLAPDGRVLVLFESQIAEAQGARSGEQPLDPLPLPYPVPCA